jgi:two-component system chemotaxis sensor kinase CheA
LTGDAKRQTLLLVRSPGNGQLAIPLARVARLEEFELERVESAGGLDVIQYRGQILPLIHLQDVLEERRSISRLANNGADLPTPSLLQVVVFGNDRCNIGLVVDDLIDIAEETLQVQGQATRGGVTGTAVIQNRVTELFDVEAFLERLMPLAADIVEG